MAASSACFLSSLEFRQLARRLFGAPFLTVEIVELEPRRGQLRIELRRQLELRHRRVGAALQLVQGPELIVPDGLIGHKLDHAFELRHRRVRVARLLVINAQVEPGMRQLGVAPLHVFELGHAFPDLAGMEQRQPVIQLFPARNSAPDREPS